MDIKLTNSIEDLKIIAENSKKLYNETLKTFKEKAELMPVVDSKYINLSNVCVGDTVTWGAKEGRVIQLYLRKLAKTIDGKTITLEGNSENPAILILDTAGKLVFKLASQVKLKT